MQKSKALHQAVAHLDKACAFIEEAQASGSRVLVHYFAGQNKRPDPNSHFRRRCACEAEMPSDNMFRLFHLDIQEEHI